MSSCATACNRVLALPDLEPVGTTNGTTAPPAARKTGGNRCYSADARHAGRVGSSPTSPPFLSTPPTPPSLQTARCRAKARRDEQRGVAAAEGDTWKKRRSRPHDGSPHPDRPDGTPPRWSARRVRVPDLIPATRAAVRR